MKKSIKKLLPIILFFLIFEAKANVILTTTIYVKDVAPNKIYNFMFSLDKTKYIAWHNKDHKDFKVIKVTKDTVGSIFYFKEKLGKLNVHYDWEVKELVPNKKIVMKAKYFIPIYLTLTFEKTTFGTTVTHSLDIGNRSKFLDFFINSFIFTQNKKKASSQHAQEEFKYFENLP